MATQDYNEAMVPSENCEVWTSFNNVLSISTERLVHRDQRFLNHDGNRNAAHLWSPVTWLEPTFFVAPGKDFILTVSKEWFTFVLESYRLPEQFQEHYAPLWRWRGGCVETCANSYWAIIRSRISGGTFLFHTHSDVISFNFHESFIIFHIVQMLHWRIKWWFRQSQCLSSKDGILWLSSCI